ncbi:MAG: LuxR C-terminal-related transcriptional regulator [Carbonactinosporaceae bacterium]
MLATKIAIPAVPEGTVRRHRLLARLVAGARRRLTVVTAPPGGGKTVLLSCWAGEERAGGRPVAWLSLDGSDNVPAEFWTRVVAALARAHPTRAAGCPLTAPPDPPGFSEVGGRPFLTTLAGRVSRLEPPVVLILDDLHLLTNGALFAELDFLVRHSDSRLRLVLAGRREPGLPIQRYRVEGQLTRLDADDLAFTSREAGELLHVRGMRLHPAEVVRLSERTWGWAAGLALLSMPRDDRVDVGGHRTDATGEGRRVAEYLHAEVLRDQPFDVRHLLLSTSVADRLTPGLAEELSGCSAAGTMLAGLARENAFVRCVDPAVGDYRVHPLLADVLRAQLRAERPGAVAELHSRAARWHARFGDPTVAAWHYVEAGQDGRAARLLVERLTYGRLLAGGEPSRLETVLAALRPEVVAADADAAVLTAINAWSRGELEVCEAHLARAEELATGPCGPRAGPATRLAAALTRLALARGRGAVDDGLAREILQTGSGGQDGELRAGVEAWLLDALASSSVGEPLRARRSLEAALHAAGPDGLRHPFLLVAPWVRQVLGHGGDIGSAGATPVAPDGQSVPGRPPAFVDPLTRQERAVLRQLAAMLSNEEIAGEMHLSVNTVKTHLKSVYRKLGVSRRRQAVRRSRELNLL